MRVWGNSTLPIGKEILSAVAGCWSMGPELDPDQIEVVVALAQSAFAAPETGNVDEAPGHALRRHDLLDFIGQGFCVVEVLFDDVERPIDYRFIALNQAFEAQTGLENAIGKTMRSLRPDHEAHWFEIYGNVALTGEAVRFENQAAALDRWYDVFAFRVGAPAERRVAILFNDISGRKREEDLHKLIASEGDHRARNLLALVTSLVKLTRADSVAEYQKLLFGRIAALADAQHMSSGSEEGTLELSTLVERELAAYCGEGERGRWRGPTVHVTAAEAQLLGIVLHELATNAAKYGAFSTPEGCLEVEWARRSDGRLGLRWMESRGRRVVPPDSKGVGTTVICACVEDQLGGDVEFDWRPEGLVCSLALPIEAWSARRESH